MYDDLLSENSFSNMFVLSLLLKKGGMCLVSLVMINIYIDLHNGYGNMQRLIFEEAEDGVRKIVLTTNIAETSITINDVVFVLDCGKAKETSYDALNNTPCLLPTWISKVSAKQVRLYFS